MCCTRQYWQGLGWHGSWKDVTSIGNGEVGQDIVLGQKEQYGPIDRIIDVTGSIEASNNSTCSGSDSVASTTGGPNSDRGGGARGSAVAGAAMSDGTTAVGTPVSIVVGLAVVDTVWSHDWETGE